MAKNDNIGDVTGAIVDQTKELKSALNVDAVTSELKKLNDIWRDGEKESEVTEEIKASSDKNVSALAKSDKKNESEMSRILKESKMMNASAMGEFAKLNETALAAKQPLNVLTETLKDQNKVLETKLDINELSSKLIDLNKNVSENSLELTNQFDAVRTILENPESSDEDKANARDNLDALGKLALNEEKRREDEQKLKEQSSIWNKIKENTKGTMEGLKDLVKGLGKNGGLLAGLAGVALMLFDPETFIDIIKGAVDFVFDMFKAIKKVIDGDIGGAFDIIKEHLVGFGLAVLAIGWFLAPIVASAVGFLVTAATAMAPILAGLASFLWPIALIGLAVNAIYEAFLSAKEAFDSTGSISQTLSDFLSTFVTKLVGFPLDFLKDVLIWVAEQFEMKEAVAFLESFSIEDIVMDLMRAFTDWISDAIDNMFSWFGGGRSEEEQSKIDKFRKERDAKSEKERKTKKDDKALEKEEKEKPRTVPPSEIEKEKPEVSRKDWKDPSGKKWGNPAKIEKMEADSGVYTKTNENINAKSVADKQPGNVVIAPGGSSSNNNSTNNVSTSNVTVSNGITPDDMIKKDFYNYGY